MSIPGQEESNVKQTTTSWGITNIYKEKKVFALDLF